MSGLGWFAGVGATIGFVGAAVLAGSVIASPAVVAYLAIGGGLGGLTGGCAIHSKIEDIIKRKRESRNNRCSKTKTTKRRGMSDDN